MRLAGFFKGTTFPYGIGKKNELFWMKIRK